MRFGNGGCKSKNIPNEKDKMLALKIQLNFRQVIRVNCERSFFTLSSGGKTKLVSEL